ncbi:hypothetical protein DERP_001097 [Dermatophagoides pteronyssinus]|uniref:Uncharacterized protein n=1 Tax=Dermatophagoides pteronyssinus TaxID=6956 RepID=A0ABQ8JDH1_DERPT|nr:hypothetical protein DERP_001097 [Dermatophagoides pteronyssinus]
MIEKYCNCIKLLICKKRIRSRPLSGDLVSPSNWVFFQSPNHNDHYHHHNHHNQHSINHPHNHLVYFQLQKKL